MFQINVAKRREKPSWPMLKRPMSWNPSNSMMVVLVGREVGGLEEKRGRLDLRCYAGTYLYTVEKSVLRGCSQ